MQVRLRSLISLEPSIIIVKNAMPSVRARAVWINYDGHEVRERDSIGEEA